MDFGILNTKLHPDRMPLFCLLLLPFFASACQSAPTRHTQTPPDTLPENILNIRDIAGQTQEDIATILGHQSQLDAETAARSGCPTCQKYAYQDGLVRIVYINDMADWLTITPRTPVAAVHTPSLLGLPAATPDYADDKVLRWNRYEGIREISAYRKTDGTVDYIYMKVTTP